jgi:hypothetical protein
VKAVNISEGDGGQHPAFAFSIFHDFQNYRDSAGNKNNPRVH